MDRLPAADIARLDRPIDLEFGEPLSGVEVAYETWGELSEERDNAVMICPAFSAHSHARSSDADPSEGWWEAMVGPGLWIDTDRWFVVCASLLGGCYGTTGPRGIREDGSRWASDFPVVSVRDMVDTHVALLDHLGIDRLHAAVGGSLGAMQTLQMGVRHADRVGRVLAISGTARTRPYTAAIRHMGRQCIMSDPAFAGGHYDQDEGPAAGLRMARELGTILYRSREEFNDRFHNEPINPPAIDGITFDVQSYLAHQGKKALTRFDANAYLVMSLAMDLHNAGRGHDSLEAAFRKISAEVHVVGVPEDRLIPIDEQEEIRDTLESAGVKHTWTTLSSPIGHDAFLVEYDRMGPIIRSHLDA